jgi:hypothetical protein
MSENAQTLAPAQAPAAAPSREERFASALAEIRGGQVPAQAPAQAPAEAPAEVPAAVAPTSEPPAAEVPAQTPDGVKTSFEKLAREKAALRAEQEKIKPYLEASKALTAPTLAELSKAKASGDPLAALQALGFSPQALVQQLQKAQAKPPEAKEQAQQIQLPPEIQQKLAKVEYLEKFVAQQQEQQLISGIRENITDEFKFVKGLGAERQVIQMLQDFHNEHGSLPGEDFATSVKMAAELVEKQLAAEAEKYRPFLTPAQQATTIPNEAIGEQASRGQVTTGKTLTNSNTSAPAPASPKPQTREERVAEALANWNPW